MIRIAHLFALVLVAAFAAPLPASAQGIRFPWYPLVDNPDIGQLHRIPLCADPGLAGRVVNQFNDVERTYWNGQHTLVSLAGMFENGFHPARDDKVARRWCRGIALFADGAQRQIVLELSADTGFVGIGYGLAYCIQGLDRHWTYAPNCRVLRHREF